MGCGASDSVVEANSGVTVQRWFEDVTLRCPAGTVMVERRARIINIERPAMEVENNIHVGRVDLFDMLLSMYQIRHRSTKYYTHTIFHCIGVTVVNGWLLVVTGVRKEFHKKHMPLISFTVFPVKP